MLIKIKLFLQVYMLFTDTDTLVLLQVSHFYVARDKDIVSINSNMTEL